MHEDIIEDDLALRRPHPAEVSLPANEHEAVIRALGNRWIISGTAIVTIGVVAALILAVVDPRFLSTSTGMLLVYLAGMLLAGAGSSLFTAGLIERIQQPQRTLIRHAMTRANMNADLLGSLTEAIDQLAAQGQATAEELAENRQAMHAIADQLPVALRSANWRGYSDAIRQGFTAATGTDDEPRRAHINLVRPHPDTDS